MELQNSLFSLNETKQVVIGGSRGLGLKLALHLKSLGADLLVIGRSREPESDLLKFDYKSCDMGDSSLLYQLISNFAGNDSISGLSMVADYTGAKTITVSTSVDSTVSTIPITVS
jgi:NAD(P)-dependent dehydrogenase (short-subunit alcohol dehydrogenase family)